MAVDVAGENEEEVEEVVEVVTGGDEEHRRQTSLPKRIVLLAWR